jgi:hypothetical protein
MGEIGFAYAVSQLARFCASADPRHTAALHHLMEYPASYPSFKVQHSKKRGRIHTGLDGFCDADWGMSDSQARRWTTGNIYRYNGAPMHWTRLGDDWRTKLQKTISLSTTEAEYYAASTAAAATICPHSLLKQIGFLPAGYTPVYENKACIEWSNNVVDGRERL